MSTPADPVLPPVEPGPIPPLPSGLEAELASLTPVAPRRPHRQLAAILAVSLAWSLALVGLLNVRRDLAELPRLWLVAYVVAWLLGFAVPAFLLVVPRRGEVMPRWVAAAAITGIASVGFIVAGLGLARSGPSSLHRGVSAWAGCLSSGLLAAVVPIALVALAIRGAVPTASRATAAALGACAGALGGFMLHLHCPIADGVHVGVIHGGVAVVAAGVAALTMPRWLAAA
ncbi:MAG: NrsF family protein [Kofleriaceae bacterium]